MAESAAVCNPCAGVVPGVVNVALFDRRQVSASVFQRVRLMGNSNRYAGAGRWEGVCGGGSAGVVILVTHYQRA